jgi:hypothetical protein
MSFDFERLVRGDGGCVPNRQTAYSDDRGHPFRRQAAIDSSEGGKSDLISYTSTPDRRTKVRSILKRDGKKSKNESKTLDKCPMLYEVLTNTTRAR